MSELKDGLNCHKDHYVECWCYTCNKDVSNERSVPEDRQPQLEPGKELFIGLGHRLVRRILDAADMSLPDSTDVELSLVRIISERDYLKSQPKREVSLEKIRSLLPENTINGIEISKTIKSAIEQGEVYE